MYVYIIIYTVNVPTVP